ncbi:hypothetical protein BHE74_00026015 [Ensete ventricosum]|nr:hypothetical protein BHE74_00026015 [Ensete ventricosum]
MIDDSSGICRKRSNAGFSFALHQGLFLFPAPRSKAATCPRYFSLSITGGFYLQTHDFSRPLVEEEERQQEEKQDSSRGNGEATAANSTTTETPPQHVLLPGGIGKYSITHVRGADAKRSKRGLALPGGPGEGSKSKPDYYDSPHTYDAAVWSDGQWLYRPFGARGSSVATSAATRLASTSSSCHGHLFMRFSGSYWWFISWSRWHAAPETKLLMEAAEQCDDELFGKREGSSSRKDVDSAASRSPSQWLRLPVRADCGASDIMQDHINLFRRIFFQQHYKLNRYEHTLVHEDPVSTKSSNHSMKGSSSERPSQRPKRGRMDNS